MRLFPSARRPHALSRLGGGRVSTIEGAAIAEFDGIRLPIRGRPERVFRGLPNRLPPLSLWFRLHRSIVHASCGIFGIAPRPLQLVPARSRRRIGKASPTRPRMLAEPPVFARPQHWGDAALFLVPWAGQGPMWREPRQRGPRTSAGTGAIRAAVGARVISGTPFGEPDALAAISPRLPNIGEARKPAIRLFSPDLGACEGMRAACQPYGRSAAASGCACIDRQVRGRDCRRRRNVRLAKHRVVGPAERRPVKPWPEGN